MGEDDEIFLAVGVHSARLLADHGLHEGDALLDVGSGYGRLAFGLISQLGFNGRYEGLDLLPRQVTWCQDAFARYPSFKFTHADVLSHRYNPQGTIDPTEFRFPYDDASFDFCALFSVFTHMYAEDIESYMKEIGRVLKTGGVCLATFFLYNDERLSKIVSDECALPMRFELNEVSRYFNEDDVLHAISFERSYIRDMWARRRVLVAGGQMGQLGHRQQSKPLPWHRNRPIPGRDDRPRLIS